MLFTFCPNYLTCLTVVCVNATRGTAAALGVAFRQGGALFRYYFFLFYSTSAALLLILVLIGRMVGVYSSASPFCFLSAVGRKEWRERLVFRDRVILCLKNGFTAVGYRRSAATMALCEVATAVGSSDLCSLFIESVLARKHLQHLIGRLPSGLCGCGHEFYPVVAGPGWELPWCASWCVPAAASYDGVGSEDLRNACVA